MAKIKLGAIVTDIRNKLGGHVFSKNRSGSYMRTLVTPVNPQTSFQTSVRALFGAISQAWSSLTEANREAWRSSVDDWQTTDIFGDLKRPTGKALFQRLNQQAQVAGYPAVTTPPALGEVESNIVSNAVIDLTAGTLTIGSITSVGDSTAVISATPSMSQGTKFVKDKLRQISAYGNDDIPPADVYNDYIAKFGTPSAGANIYVGVKYVNETGNATPMQTLKVTVNA